MIYNFIHIPKTAGSSLRITLSRKKIKHIKYHGHSKQLNQFNNVIFVVRDPFDRFCGAYYERKNTELYNQAYEQRKKEFSGVTKNMVYGGPLSSKDRALYMGTEKPDDLMTKIRNSNGNLDWVLTYPRVKGPTSQVFGSYAYWLGTLDKFKRNESRIKHAIDIKAFSGFMLEEFNIDLTIDKVLSRDITEIKDYNLSDENREWYRNKRPQDFNLLEYIKQQEYYRS